MKNQKTIQIDKGDFTTAYYDLLEASKNLSSGAAFRLYVYLCEEENGNEITFVPARIKEDLGISINSVQNGFSQLLEHGYLEKIKDNFFIFHSIKN